MRVNESLYKWVIYEYFMIFHYINGFSLEVPPKIEWIDRLSLHFSSGKRKKKPSLGIGDIHIPIHFQTNLEIPSDKVNE